MKNIKALKQLPNLITLLNLVLGLSVLFIHASGQGEAHRLASCVLVLIAVCLDGIDGKLARRLNAVSVLGKQLDLFADFTSFGLAPTVILLTHAAVRDKGLFIYACLIFYTAAGAFRLARFNIGSYTHCFVGLPITAAGFLMIGLNLFLHYGTMPQTGGVSVLIAAYVCILAVLMLSKIKIRRIGCKKPESKADGLAQGH